MRRLAEFESSPSSKLMVITHHRHGSFCGLDRREVRTVLDRKQATRAETFEDSTRETQDEDRRPRVESAVGRARKAVHATHKGPDVDRSDGGVR
jgi:hypothetical protein